VIGADRSVMTGNDVSARDRQHLWAGDGRRLPGDRVVAESWRRAEMCGLDPGRVQQRQWDVDTDSRFLRHVRPVLDSLSTRLDGSDTSVMIADPQGRIVWRWAENPEHLRMLDRNLVCVGFDHSEEWLGTNGAGTALEVSRQVAIVGDEHFAYAMRDFACYAATVRHPVTHRVLGVADITSAASNASPLLGAILAGVIDDMGRVLLEAASVAERELLTRFLLERRRSQRPVVSVGEDFLLANRAAMRLGLSQSRLWHQIQDRGPGGLVEFPLSGQEHVVATAQPVMEGSTIVGAVVTLHDRSEPAAAPATARCGVPPARGARGRADLVHEAGEVLARRGRLLVTGETGAGKVHLLRAVFEGRETPVAVLDAAMAPVEGPALWVKRLRLLLDAGSQGVVLRHVDALPPEAGASLLAVLAEDRADPPLITATATSADLPQRLLDVFGAARLEVPPLRSRTADIPDLLARLSAAHVSASAVRFSAAAVELLQEYDWPGNVRQLSEIVREIVEGMPLGVVGPQGLPPQIRAAGRRNLSPLEKAEASVIARVLEESGWNKKLAAQRLQIARGSLYQKMRHYRITGP